MVASLMPRVSVVMAVRNGEPYLPQAIESVLGQSYADFEFIILDDGSTDDSYRIISEYSDPRIKLTRHHDPLGLTRSLNIGLKLAQAEYVARMDSDDMCLPRRLEMQVDYLDAHPGVTVLGTGVTLIRPDGAAVGDVHFPVDHEIIRWQLAFHNPIAHPSVMMRATGLASVGYYDEACLRSQDYDLWWRLSFTSELANLQEIGLYLRLHSNRITNVFGDEQYEAGVKINQKHLSRLLSQSVPANVIQSMWSRESSTAEDAIAASQTILLYGDRMRDELRSERARQIIGRDIVLRTVTLLRSFLLTPRVWLMLLGIARSDPASFIQTLLARGLAQTNQS